jgi:hypothetical protein
MSNCSLCTTHSLASCCPLFPLFVLLLHSTTTLTGNGHRKQFQPSYKTTPVPASFFISLLPSSPYPSPFAFFLSLSLSSPLSISLSLSFRVFLRHAAIWLLPEIPPIRPPTRRTVQYLLPLPSSLTRPKPISSEARFTAGIRRRRRQRELQHHLFIPSFLPSARFGTAAGLP